MMQTPSRHIHSKPMQAMGLAFSVLITFVAAVLGAMASIRAADFYDQLLRPEWAPPSSVFSPTWTTLYILMAISAWLVWRTAGLARARHALTLFLGQLALNALWSWPFFVWKLGGAALVNIAALWVLIILTIVNFWRINRLAALLLVPYLLWVSFAAVLNYTVWMMNPQLLG